MENSSFSSTVMSYNPNEPWTREQEIAVYKSIKMNLEDIRHATNSVNLKFKAIQKEMHVTDALVNAIELKSTAVDQRD
ncbi:hypothetical protein PUN28_005492 [Cardiocondyla obscurior]|uniref:Uncharacterized protein n=1 Tax=Cardiocondyla obscurior TaxID=286306 RepID=A0AAW2GI59_9HYME